MHKKDSLLKKIFYFYVDGFKSMTWGKSLWLLILIKLFVMFFILKLFFFPDFLNHRFESEEERSDYVIEELTTPKNIKDD